MAGARNRGKQNEVVSSEEKTARLLALLLTRDLEQRADQVAILIAAGFQVSEISAMLRITEHHVHVAAHQSRKKKPKGKASARAAG